MIRRTWKMFLDLWEDDPETDALVYDPVHVAGVIVACLFALGLMFWTLWALLVFEGGLFVKAGPFLKVIFTSKRFQDFGFVGYPYEMGIFEGWIVNLAALAATIGFIAALWAVFRPPLSQRR